MAYKEAKVWLLVYVITDKNGKSDCNHKLTEAVPPDDSTNSSWWRDTKEAISVSGNSLHNNNKNKSPYPYAWVNQDTHELPKWTEQHNFCPVITKSLMKIKQTDDYRIAPPTLSLPLSSIYAQKDQNHQTYCIKWKGSSSALSYITQQLHS